MKNIPTVFVVTAVHNYRKHTEGLLRSISSQDYERIKTIILDDSSTDDTVSFIESRYPETILVRGNGKLWWTGGINEAIKEALKYAKETDYILTINNDCIFDRDYISRLVKLSRSQTNSVIGSLDIDKDSRKVVTGYLYVDWEKGVWKNEKKIIKGIVETDYLMTKGTLFPVRLFREIGLLDFEHFPHYGSDVEFTNRAKMAGYKLVIHSSIRVLCDRERTGMLHERKPISLASLLGLLFSRRSTINIKDHYYLIKYICPREYQAINYLRLVSKGIYIFSFYWLFYPLRSFIPNRRKKT